MEIYKLWGWGWVNVFLSLSLSLFLTETHANLVTLFRKIQIDISKFSGLFIPALANKLHGDEP